MAWVRIAKYTPRTRLRKLVTPINSASNPGISRPSSTATGNEAKNGKNHGGLRSPTPLITTNSAVGMSPLGPCIGPWLIRYSPMQ